MEEDNLFFRVVQQEKKQYGSVSDFFVEKKLVKSKSELRREI
jgi:hypothetical protein